MVARLRRARRPSGTLLTPECALVLYRAMSSRNWRSARRHCHCHRLCLRLAPAVLLAFFALFAFFAFAVSAPAFAQKDPKFDFGKPEEAKVVEWKAQAKGGFALTT